MTEQEARQLGDNARAASALVNLWLEHPWIAHDLHERAASAYEQLTYQANAAQFKLLAVEHRAAAQHCANLESNWSKLMGYNQRDCEKQHKESKAL